MASAGPVPIVDNGALGVGNANGSSFVHTAYVIEDQMSVTCWKKMNCTSISCLENAFRMKARVTYLSDKRSLNLSYSKGRLAKMVRTYPPA